MSDPNRTYTTTDWAGETSTRWVAAAEQLEAQLAPVSDVLFAAASLAAGERVLDVGCGRGVTTRQAAELVGPTGSATGLDVSEELLAAAEELAVGLPNVSFRHGDGQRTALEPASFDVLLSRFGVMFFDDAAAAMANLGGAVRPGGRLCVAVWRPRTENEMMQWPIDVALEVADRLGVELELPDPNLGPFSWGDERFVVDTLSTAGWADVVVTPRPVSLYLGGSASPQDAVVTSLTVGPLRSALAALADDTSADVEGLESAIRQALVAAFTERHDGTGVPVSAMPVIVTARRS